MNKREEKYHQVKSRYAPLVEMKDYAVQQIIRTGKKMGSWRYVMIPVLFVFLFVFHFSYHLCIQLKMKEKMARGVAFAMSLVMIFTSVNVTAFAIENVGNQTDVQLRIVRGFEELPEEVEEQTLAVGADSQDRYGRKIRPPAPAGMLLAAASKALGEPTSKSFCAQLTHFPAQRIAPKTETLCPSSVLRWPSLRCVSKNGVFDWPEIQAAV